MEKQSLLKLTKIAELENAEYPNNYPVGYETIRPFIEEWFKTPTLGQRFWVGTFSTSPVQEILTEDTFKTTSSIYKWEKIN